MIIVTAGNDKKNFREMIDINGSQISKFGYCYRIYDLGGLGKGIKFEETFGYSAPTDKAPICRLKPQLLLHTLKETDGFVVWLDADTLLLRPLDHIKEEEGWDIGVTYRGGSKQYVNAGVLFLNNTAATKGFIEEWISTIPPADELPTDVPNNRIGDQIFLNKLIFSNVKKGRPLMHHTVEIAGAQVRFFDLRKYNFEIPAFTEKKTDEYIVHFCSVAKGKYARVAKMWGVKC